MTILFDVLLRVARSVDEDIVESLATGGSATTLVDSSANLEADDFWNGGTLFFKTGAAGRINTTAIVTDFTQTTGTFTFATGTAIAATNQYLALTKSWPRSRLVQAVNTALQRQYVVTDDISLTGVSGQFTYDLPAGIAHVLQVFTGSEAAGWDENHTWKEEGPHLRFYANEPSADTILLRYLAKPATVTADADTISTQVNVDLLVYDALAELWFARAQRSDENPRAEGRYKTFAGEAERIRARVKYPNSATRYSGL